MYLLSIWISVSTFGNKVYELHWDNSYFIPSFWFRVESTSLASFSTVT